MKRIASKKEREAEKEGKISGSVETSDGKRAEEELEIQPVVETPPHHCYCLGYKCH